MNVLSSLPVQLLLLGTLMVSTALFGATVAELLRRNSAAALQASSAQPIATAKMVRGLIGAHDLAGDAVKPVLAGLLSDVDVAEISVETGELFNPVVHEAVATLRSPDPQLHHRIAELIRPGWRSSDAVLRPPQVSVWTVEEAGL